MDDKDDRSLTRKGLHALIRFALWLPRLILSRLFIFVFMLGVLIASHTLTWAANITFTALSAGSRLISTQAFEPKSFAHIKTQNQTLRSRVHGQKRVTTTHIKRVQHRMRRTALANLAATGGEALPFIGIAVVAGATVYEMKSSCDTMRDLYELQLEVDPAEANPDDRDMVCGLQVPTQDALWATIKSAPGDAWDGAVGATEGTADWAKSLERPDFGGAWQRTVNAVGDWF